jgi:hypothetical protein
MVLMIVRQVDRKIEWWPKDTENKLNLMGDYQARVNSGQMALVVVRQGGWTMGAVAKDTQMKAGRQL